MKRPREQIFISPTAAAKLVKRQRKRRYQKNHKDVVVVSDIVPGEPVNVKVGGVPRTVLTKAKYAPKRGQFKNGIPPLSVAVLRGLIEKGAFKNCPACEETFPRHRNFLINDNTCLRCAARATADMIAEKGARYAAHVNHVRRSTAKKRTGDAANSERRFEPCAICGVVGTQEKPNSLDHDHPTGHFREPLCQGCNLGISHFGNSPARCVGGGTYHLENAILCIEGKRELLKPGTTIRDAESFRTIKSSADCRTVIEGAKKLIIKAERLAVLMDQSPYFNGQPIPDDPNGGGAPRGSGRRVPVLEDFHRDDFFTDELIARTE